MPRRNLSRQSRSHRRKRPPMDPTAPELSPTPLRASSRAAAASKPEIDLSILLRAEGVPDPMTEYKFHEVRKWRFDFAWPLLKVAVEVQGGGRGHGRHHRNDGYRKDCEKMAFAVMEGWKVLWIVPEQIYSGEALEWIKQLVPAHFVSPLASKITQTPATEGEEGA